MQKEIHFNENGRRPEEVFKKLGFSIKHAASHDYWSKESDKTYISIERSRTPYIFPYGIPVCADYVASISAYDPEDLRKAENSLEINLRRYFIIKSKKEYYI